MRRFDPKPLRAAIPLLAAALLALASGCSVLLGNRSEPPRLYVLSAEPAATTHTVPPSTLLGFGPVDLPGYLDRRGIVTRVAPNRLEATRNDLWAEPLGTNFKNVLEQDLRSRLPGVPIRSFPWPQGATPSLAIAIEVTRFEATAAGTVELQARWVLRSPRETAVHGSHDTALVEPIGGATSEDVVAALSRALGALADQIAVALADQAAADARSAPARARRAEAAS